MTGWNRERVLVPPLLQLLCAVVLCAIAATCAGAWAFPERACAVAEVSVEADAAVDEQLGVGIEQFHRAKRGSSSPLPDRGEVGYRYITGAPESAVLIVLEDAAVLYVSPEVCAHAGLDVHDAAVADELVALFSAVDGANADGGVPLSDLDVPVTVTDEADVKAGRYRFRFAVESQGRTYAAVSFEPGEASGAPKPLFCDYGLLVRSDELDVVASRTLLEELSQFFERLDWSPLFVSMRTALLATLLSVLIGIVAAWLTLKLGTRAKSVIDVLFLIPMVLPPTACGIILVYVFGKNSPTGRWLIDIGVNLPFTWQAAVIAALVVSLPFMFRSARGAFENLDPDLLDAARTLGWSEPRILARLMVPVSAPALVAGAVLSFSRALGEFGATVFFAGNYAGITQTIPLAIYYDWMGGDAASTWFWVAVTLLFMFVFLIMTQRFTKR